MLRNDWQEFNCVRSTVNGGMEFYRGGILICELLAMPCLEHESEVWRAEGKETS